MADPSSVPPQPRRSSVLYALGRLAAESEQHTRTLDELPGVLALQLSPLSAQLAEHGRRISGLERQQWLWLGGAGTLSAVAITLAEYYHVLPLFSTVHP